MKTKTKVETIYPLSPMQEGMLFHALSDPESGMYLQQLTCRLLGNLDLSAFREGWQRTMERHPILRTAFVWKKQERPLQVVQQDLVLPVEHVDWREFSREAQRQKLLELLEHGRKEGFELSKAPLLRLQLIRSAPATHIFVFNFHHLLLDGWSLSIVLKEVFDCYEAFTQRKDLFLQSARPYRDYISWLRGQDPDAADGFWRRTLQGFDVPTPLPVSTAPGGGERKAQGSCGKEAVNLSRKSTERLVSTGRANGVTLNTIVQAAWAYILSRHSGKSLVTFGVTVSGRPSELKGVDGMTGLFINTLPLRVDLTGEQELLSWLKKIQKQNLELREYEYCSLNQIQRSTEVPLGKPLFESIVVFENYPVDSTLKESRITDIEIADVEFFENTNYPLVVGAFPGEELSLWIYYDDVRYDSDSVTALLRQLKLLLEQIGTDLRQPLSRLSLLSDEERERVLITWNRTQTGYPQSSIAARFEAQVAKTPDAVALISEQGELTYSELNEQANQLAHHLIHLGVGPEVVVAVLLERSLELVLTLVAILKAGGAYHSLSPDYPRERLKLLFQEGGAQVLVSQEEFVSLIPFHSALVVFLDRDQHELLLKSRLNPEVEVTPDHLAYVSFTSGSTGKPKGVAVLQRGVVRLVQNTDYVNFGEDQTLLQFSPASFDASTFEIWGALLNGGRLVLAPAGTTSLRELGALIQEKGVSTLWLTAGIFHLMVDEELESLRGVRQLLAGGDVLISSQVRKVLRDLPHCQLINGYGPTENTTFTCCYSATNPEHVSAFVPLGRPIANTEVYILDANLEPLPVGVAGELYAGGAGLARGYVNQPDLTAESFIPHPFSKERGARLYRTGDLARFLPDGNVEFLGRRDHQVKVRGFRIELGEIEATLTRHPEIRVAVVLAPVDPAGNKRLVAYLCCQRPIAQEELREWLKRELPEYMIPAGFVFLERFPLNANGKVDRNALPAWGESRPELEEKYLEPRNEVERTLARIWGEVLALKRVGVNDNFFELGGDSILSIRVVAKACEAGIKLTPRDLFEHQTVATLAAVAHEAPLITANQGPVTGQVPLTPIQHWFFEHELIIPQHWNQAVLLETPEALDPELLGGALKHLLTHHDALRLRYRRDGAGWRQEIVTPVTEPLPITCFDLSEQPRERHLRLIEELGGKLQVRLDLKEGPLIQVASFNMGAGLHGRLLLVIHHLAVDGISWRILLEDLQTAYRQLSRGEGVRLPAKTSSFKEWGERLAQFAQSMEVCRELEYWEKVSLKPTPLPLDHPLGSNDEAMARTLSVSLSKEETRLLLQEVHQPYRTQMNDVLLTALVLTLAGWTGRGRQLIDLEGHGREEIGAGMDVSRTVGWFTTIFPVHLEVDTGAGAGELLKGIKEQLREVPGRGIGYGLLRYLAGTAERQALQGQAQAEVSFNYLGQFQDLFTGDVVLGLGAEDVGPVRQGKRKHLLDVQGYVVHGKLQIDLIYGGEQFDRGTMERLAQGFLAALQGLITHCLSAEAGGYTPSDFPLAGVDQRSLDRLMQDYPEAEDFYPLTPMQQGLLFHSLYSPNSGEYVVQLGFEVSGLFRAEAFLQSWQLVMDQHPVLRTGFVWDGLRVPLQVVSSQVELRWEFHDWRELSSPEQKELLRKLLEEDRRRGFDLRKPPLIRLQLVQLRDDFYYCLCSHHHLLLDGWSLSLIIKELLTLYHGSTLSVDSRLPHPFRGYLEWLALQDFSRAEAFWRGELAGFSAPTPFGIDQKRRLPEGAREYDERQDRLSCDLTQSLTTLVRRHHLTLNTLVQGAWGLLLSQYSGESDVVFGAVVSGRPPELAGVESMVGLFINTVPVRVRVTQDSSLSAWLKGFQEQQVRMRQFEYSSLVDVQGWSEVPRGANLFESIVVFENYPVNGLLNQPDSELRIGGVRIAERTNYPFTLTVIPGEELTVKVMYDCSRFSSPVIEMVLRHLEALLRNMAADPEQVLARLSSIPEMEEQLVAQWNRTEAPFPSTSCIHELFESQARKTPEAVAVLCAGERLSYGELNARANQVARLLLHLGVGPGVFVGLYLERSVEAILGILAVLKAGGAYLPLDPAYPKSRIGVMLEDVQVPVLLTVERLAGEVPATEARLLRLDADRHRFQEESTEDLPRQVTPDSFAYVIYTSGSTGRPKGAGVFHRGVCNLLHWYTERFSISRQDRTLLITSLGFDLTQKNICATLAKGGTLVILTGIYDPEEVMERLIEDQISLMNCTPSHFSQLLDIGGGDALDLLRYLFLGGEPINTAKIAAWASAKPRTLRIVNSYGPTECTDVVSYYEIGDYLELGERVPIGKPIPNARLYVLDDQGQPAPVGVSGEICIGGVPVGAGYLSDPALTSLKFRPDPFDRYGGRLYRSGDAGRWLPDGNLEFLGRTDQQVKLHGFRIELGEIEASLAQHPKVADAVVVVAEGPPGAQRLAAYLVPRDEEVVPGSELRSFLKGKLPDYMIPGSYLFLDRFPLSPNGKVDRKALPVSAVTWESERTFLAPRTETERKIAEVWSEILGTPEIGVLDNFVDLGGHSLLATQLVSRLREAFQLELPLRTVFEEPTVAGLAGVIESILRSANGPLGTFTGSVSEEGEI